MPSIRVRKSTYFPLEDPNNPTNEPRPLASIFARPDQVPPLASSSRPDPPRTQVVVPSTNLNRNASRSPVRQRPRAGSRVTQHCIRQSLRFREGDGPTADEEGRPSCSDSHRSASPMRLPTHGGMITMEGPQADVWVHSDGEPGLIGSALSLHSSGRSHTEISDDGHHHDDIVEHLDCIGNFRYQIFFYRWCF